MTTDRLCECGHAESVHAVRGTICCAVEGGVYVCMCRAFREQKQATPPAPTGGRE